MYKMTLADFARRAQLNAKKIERKIVAMFEKTPLTGEELEQMIPAKTANKKQALPSREIVARFAAPPEEYKKVLRGVYLNTEDNTIVASNGNLLAVASDLIYEGEKSNGCYVPIDVKNFPDRETKEKFLKANETLSIDRKMYVKNDYLHYPDYQDIIPKDYQYCMDCKSLIDKIPHLKALYHFGINFGDSVDCSNGNAVKLNLKCEKTGKEQTTVLKTECLLKILDALKDTGLKNESKIYFNGKSDNVLVFENSKIKIIAAPIKRERLKLETIPSLDKMNRTGCTTQKTELAPGCFMEMLQEDAAGAPAPVEAETVKTGEAPAPVETETVKTENRNGEKQTRYKFYCRRENDLNFIRLRAEMDGKTYPPEPVRKTDKLKNLYGGIARTTAKVAAAIGAFLMQL